LGRAAQTQSGEGDSRPRNRASPTLRSWQRLAKVLAGANLIAVPDHVTSAGGGSVLATPAKAGGMSENSP